MKEGVRVAMISAVVPVYNSEKSVGKVVDRLITTFNLMDEVTSYEIILVNDGSRDDSEDVCRELAKKETVVFLNLTKNFGQHHALMAGYRHSKGDYIVKVDDDLQIIPEEIPKLYNHLIVNNHDVVFGKFIKKGHDGFRNFGSYVNNLMASWLLDKPKNIKVSSFYIMRRYVVDGIAEYSNPYPYIAGLIFKVTDNIGNIEVLHSEREDGSSNYTFIKLLKLWFNGFTNFSVKPLRITTVIGMILSSVGFILSILLVVRKFLNQDVQLGWTSTIALIVFFGGIQLISIGMLGEYIGRIFISVNNFPQYVIKETLDESVQSESE